MVQENRLCVDPSFDPSLDALSLPSDVIISMKVHSLGGWKPRFFKPQVWINTPNLRFEEGVAVPVPRDPGIPVPENRL